MTSPPPEPTASERLGATGVAGAVLCCALWGGNAVAVKFSVPDLPPFGCAGLRFLISLPVIAVVCRGLGQTLRISRPFWGLVGMHAVLTVLQIGTYNWGTSHSLAGRASVFINVHPLVVAPLAWGLLGERLGIRALVGLGAAALGVLILLSSSLQVGGSLAGDLVVLASGTIFGIQTIAQKKAFRRISPTSLLFAQTLLAIPLFFAYSAIVEGFETYRFTPEAVGGLLFQGLAVSGICFTTWMLLLKRYPAGRLATIAFLTPLFGVGLGHLTRGESLSWHLLAGGSLVGWGIYLVASDRTAHGQDSDIALPGEDAP
jgi:drug/metabolite transporter (DMT)-like permease